jgi:hypothetical protein
MPGKMAETKKIKSSQQNNVTKLIYPLTGFTLVTNQPNFPI